MRPGASADRAIQHPQAQQLTMYASTYPDDSTRPSTGVLNLLSVPAAAQTLTWDISGNRGAGVETGRRELLAGDGSSAYWGVGSVDRRIQQQQQQQQPVKQQQKHQHRQIKKQPPRQKQQPNQMKEQVCVAVVCSCVCSVLCPRSKEPFDTRTGVTT